MDAEFATFLAQYQDRVDTALHRWLPAAELNPAQLHQAMRYATLTGGKRVRPVLVYAAGSALGADLPCLDGAACAVELIHAYSLVHDDLPAMDDDELRRGKPTCHIAFGEATAILAGDALQALAFYILAHDPDSGVSAEARLKMIETLAIAAGSRGMVGGQAIDLAAVGQDLNIVQLENMHIHKTGALIRASAMLGSLCAKNVTAVETRQLDHYAKCIGLAFQIRDDILDVEGDTSTLGKTQGADKALNKPTYAELLGLEGAKTCAKELYEEAMESIASFDDRARALRLLAAYIVERIK